MMIFVVFLQEWGVWLEKEAIFNNKITSKTKNVMTDKSLKNKILSFFNPSTEVFPAQQTNGRDEQREQKLTQSQETINRMSYLSKEEIQLKRSRKRGAEETTKKKKKFLNVISDPHKQDFRGLSSSSIKLPVNLSLNSRVSRYSKTSETSERQFKRSQSLRSMQTLSVKIQSKITGEPKNRSSIIVQQRIVPILIQASNRPSSLVKLSHQEPPTPVQKLVQVGFEGKTKINHNHSHLHRAQGLNTIPAQTMTNLHPNPPPQSIRQISFSPEQGTSTPSMLHTPIRAFMPSPQTATPTDRSVFQRNQELRCNIQIKNKLNINTSFQGQIFDYMRVNPHQKAINMLSDPQFAQVPPIIRAIDRRDPLQLPIQTTSILAEPSHLDSFPQTNIKNQSQSVFSSQHKLGHSPNPTRNQREDTCNFVQKSEKSINEGDVRGDLPRMSPLLLKNRTKTSKKGSFFQQSFQECTPARENNFMRVMSNELHSINSQRIETETRITRRLDQLSERASSMIRMYSQQSRASPDSPTRQQPLMSFNQNTKRQLLLNSKHANPKKHNLCTQKHSFSLQDKQNLPKTSSNQIRRQILTRIFS